MLQRNSMNQDVARARRFRCFYSAFKFLLGVKISSAWIPPTLTECKQNIMVYIRHLQPSVTTLLADSPAIHFMVKVNYELYLTLRNKIAPN